MRELKLNPLRRLIRLKLFNKSRFSILPVLMCVQVAEAQTFQLSDNLATDGSGNAGSGVNVETTGLYRQSDGAAGNPSGFNAILVGSQYGDANNIYRGVLNFDLSGLPAAAAGFEYQVTDVSLRLEVSGGTNDNRPATLIDFYGGSFETGALPGAAAASVLFNESNGTFVTTSLGVPTLDLTTDSNFFITLDAPLAQNDPGSNFYTFGSGSGPNIGFGGTTAIVLAPELQISVNLVASVPEPSSALLLMSGMACVCIGRRRRA